MNIFRTRKFININLLLLNIVSPVLATETFLESQGQNKLINSNFLKSENLRYLPSNDYQKKRSFDNHQQIASNQYSKQKLELEIKSDDQYQEDDTLYAEGNVVVTYKGNTLYSDKLIYDKFKETVQADGNVKLILGDQVFTSEQIYYDFKSKKGYFLKVKGLIKTNNFVENLDLTSYDSEENSSIFRTITKTKLLHTPNTINNWIFYTDKLKVEKNIWSAQEAIFSNDLLETNQVNFRINALKITPKKDELKLKSSINYLIFDEKLVLPFWFGNRTIIDSEEGYLFGLKPKWSIGFDKVDKDGYFLGRRLDPIKLTDDFKLNLEPQFLIQRSSQGYTKSFVSKGESVTSKKSRRETNFADYFGLDAEVNGKINKWDLKISNKLNSFDSDKFLDAVRFKVDLSKKIKLIDSEWEKSFFGVYRDRIWNGSIGESEIYIGYGTKLEKTNTWDKNGVINEEKITMGVGNFKGEELNGKNLVTTVKGSLFYSLIQKYPLKVNKPKNKFVDDSFDYVFEPVTQGIYLNTQISALYSFYTSGDHQEYIGFGAGPEFIFGEFKKKFLDYTKLSVFPSYRLKSGNSIFKFDEISDQFTLDLAYDQQIYGPLILKTNATLNLDENSEDYGDFINTNISLNWKKRSYELGIFYQPHNQSGGINFSLYGFE